MMSSFCRPTTLVALLVILTACSTESNSGVLPNASEEDSTAVAGYELRPRDLSKSIRISGTIEPKERILLQSRINVMLTGLDVEAVDQVQHGQLLAQSDTTELEAELRRAQAQVSALQRRYDRLAPLAESNAVRRAEVEDLESEIEIAASEVPLWQARIDLSRVRAPRDAVVTARHIDPGGYIDPGQPILDLADLSTLMIPVRMSERDVIHLDIGTAIKITVDAYPERTLDATIRRIFPTSDADSRQVTVELAIGEIPQELAIRPGDVIVASTMTNLATVTPFLLITGLAAMLFRELIITISLPSSHHWPPH